MGRQDTLAVLVWICCAAGLGGCYPDSFGSHPCAGCLECEECVEGVDGPHCAATPAAIYRCAADGHVHSYDSCDADEGVYDHCPEHAECVEISTTDAECVCLEKWEGEDCDVCPDNWDYAQDCASCANSWQGDECEVCPDNWDPAKNCGQCLPGWSGTDCNTTDECFGGEFDLLTHLCWENPPPSELMEWESAVSYCEELVLGFQSDWRMPTISELRGLVRNCPGTETGGECGVTDDCSEFNCWDLSACEGCTTLSGDGFGGCYWVPWLGGSCENKNWASTPYPGSPTSAWYVWFENAEVRSSTKAADHSVRCVRTVD
jgi:hypothetical protein